MRILTVGVAALAITSLSTTLVGTDPNPVGAFSSQRIADSFASSTAIDLAVRKVQPLYVNSEDDLTVKMGIGELDLPLPDMPAPVKIHKPQPEPHPAPEIVLAPEPDPFVLPSPEMPEQVVIEAMQPVVVPQLAVPLPQTPEPATITAAQPAPLPDVALPVPDMPAAVKIETAQPQPSPIVPDVDIALPQPQVPAAGIVEAAHPAVVPEITLTQPDVPAPVTVEAATSPASDPRPVDVTLPQPQTPAPVVIEAAAPVDKADQTAKISQDRLTAETSPVPQPRPVPPEIRIVRLNQNTSAVEKNQTGSSRSSVIQTLETMRPMEQYFTSSPKIVRIDTDSQRNRTRDQETTGAVLPSRLRYESDYSHGTTKIIRILN